MAESFTTLSAALAARAQDHPSRAALRFGDQRWSYGELDRLINRAAHALCELGARRGSKVALMLPNGPTFVACWLGSARLGATLVPLNTRLRGDLLTYQLGHAAPDLAVVHRAYLETFDAAHAATGLSRLVRAASGGQDRPPGWLDFDRALADAPDQSPRLAQLPPDGLAAIVYTSGTTGRPKGVMIGCQAQLRHGQNYRGLLVLQPGETSYVYLPLFHVTAMGSTLGSLLSGANVALDDGFSPFGFWERTRAYNAVVFTFVGSVLTTLFHRLPRPDDGDNPVRRTVGAATPVWIWRAFEQRFGLEIVETYGQTEMVALWLMPPPAGRAAVVPVESGGTSERTAAEQGGAELAARVGTVGRAVPDRFEVRIVGPDHRERLVGETGEIAIRPADRLDMMLGYYQDTEATRAALPGDGWYYTGDLGQRDVDGYVRFAGRLRDCIRRRGEMISAYEIERVVNAHPGVLESAAVGVASEHGEEDVKLCVVPRSEIDLEPRQIWEHCRAELPSFMLPRWIQLREALPKTATERVRKPDLVAEGTIDCWTAGDG